MWSVGACALCAALTQGQTPCSDRAPDGRSFLAVDEKQSVNHLAPRPGQYFFSVALEARYLLAEPSVRQIAGDKPVNTRWALMIGLRLS